MQWQQAPQKNGAGALLNPFSNFSGVVDCSVMVGFPGIADDSVMVGEREMMGAERADFVRAPITSIRQSIGKPGVVAGDACGRWLS